MIHAIVIQPNSTDEYTNQNILNYLEGFLYNRHHKNFKRIGNIFFSENDNNPVDLILDFQKFIKKHPEYKESIRFCKMLRLSEMHDLTKLF